MSLKINTNVAALTTHKYLSGNSAKMSASMDKLSSGLRITKAGDDAAGLAIANKFKADIKSMQVASRNVSEATSLIQIAEGSVSTVESIIVRMKELATQGASANAGSQLTVLNSEFQALKSEINRLVAGTNYQGVELIDGTFAAQTFQVGASNAAFDQLAISLGNLDTSAAGLNIAANDLTTQANAQASMTALDAALTTVNGELGRLGAYQNRLDYAGKNLASSIQNYSASESVIRDVDMAKEMVDFTKSQVLQQAGVAMLAQANQAPQAVLSLLR